MKFLPFLSFDFITSPFETVEIDSCLTSLLIVEFPFEADGLDFLVSTLSISDMSSLCCSAPKREKILRRRSIRSDIVAAKLNQSTS